MMIPEILYLSRKDVEDINLPMHDIIIELERMFLEKGRGQTEMPPKLGIHPAKESFIHAMPASIPLIGAAGMKWVSTFPGNLKKGLPNIMGLIILNSTETGLPVTVMDATWITAKRTGAATAIAAKYLARKESSRIGIIACGVQGRSNLEALSELFRISSVKVYDVYTEAAKKYADEMGAALNVTIEIADNPKEVVTSSDIVVTCGPIRKKPEPVIEAGWLAEGAFAGPVDYDSYWTPAALAQADKFVTDDKEQFASTRTTGYVTSTPIPYADLGEIVAGIHPGRESENERNICMNLGMALDDMATAVPIYKKALQLGVGKRLKL